MDSEDSKEPGATSGANGVVRLGGRAAERAWEVLRSAERYGLQILRLRRDDAGNDSWAWVDVNARALELFGFDPDDPDGLDPSALRGGRVREFVRGEANEALLERLRGVAAEHGPKEFEQFVPGRDPGADEGGSRDDGEAGAWFHVTVIPAPADEAEDGGGEPGAVTLLVVSRAITEYKALLRSAVDLMNHDDLTGLANRRLLKARFWVRRRRSAPVSLLYFDLNGFKSVNDTYGHETGDRVLEITARRLEANTRPDETVARIGGDEFAVLLGATERHAVERVVERLQRAIEAPIHLDGKRLRISSAVGVAHHPDDGESFDALMSAGDRRMYARKREHHEAERRPEP